MKKILYIIFIVILLLLVGCSDSKKSEDFELNSLAVIVPDGLWDRAFWPEAVKDFEAANSCRVDFNFISMDSEFIKDVIGDSLKSDVVLGINEAYSVQMDTTSFVKYIPENSNLSQEFVKLNSCNLTPVYYSYLALLYKQDQVPNPPSTCGSLQDGIWVNSLIVPSAESSELGRSNMLWSVAAFGKNGFGHFWRSIKENVFSITATDGDAFRMFLADEASMMLGYSSYNAYLKQKDDHSVSVMFLHEGSFQTVFQGGILVGSQQVELSKKFMDFLLTTEFQNKIPIGLYMYPVNKLSTIPEALKQLEKPKNLLNKNLNLKETKINMKYWISKWKKRMK